MSSHFTSTQFPPAHTDLLTLPSSFGNIYLGETFSCYLCVNNDSTIPVTDVAFKAELQTTSQRFTLADTIGTPTNSTSDLQVSLLPRQSQEFILHHDIKEMGIHILVCSVHYTPSHDKTRKFFRKFFKFQVLNPLSVKTRVNTLDDKIVLENQIQNLGSVNLFIDSLKFAENDLFVKESFNADIKLLQPQDILQQMFILSPKVEGDISTIVSPNLGRLDIHWKSTLCEPGHLQTSQLVRKVPIINPFTITVLETPVVKIQEPFKLQLRLRNNLSGERLRLSVHGTTKMQNILLLGLNDHQVGTVDAGGYIDFELQFIALSSGLQTLSGLTVNEKISGVKLELDNLATINVM
ncbi:hypothetical protein HDV01_003718 [Terramyces sp. JEL0728]|nr:hypothetical protein HDV01_003718 [Terramyces sp. JEL0728]